jgi:hypothetical protein
VRVVGVDPGLRGAMVCIEDGQVHEARFLPARGNVLDVREVMRWFADLQPDLTVIEGYLAVRRQALTALVTGASNFGRLVASVEAIGVAYSVVDCHTWQRAVGAKEGRGDAKDRALARVRKLYPRAPVIPKGCRVPHDGIVDAILIAHFARLTSERALTPHAKRPTVNVTEFSKTRT